MKLREPEAGLARVGRVAGGGVQRSIIEHEVSFAAAVVLCSSWNVRTGAWLADRPSPTVRLRSPTCESIRAISAWIGASCARP